MFSEVHKTSMHLSDGAHDMCIFNTRACTHTHPRTDKLHISHTLLLQCLRDGAFSTFMFSSPNFNSFLHLWNQGGRKEGKKWRKSAWSMLICFFHSVYCFVFYKLVVPKGSSWQILSQGVTSIIFVQQKGRVYYNMP